MRYLKLLSALALAMAAMPAAAVTPVRQARGDALILAPLTLVKVDDLSFGTIAPSTTSLGVVTINAVSGARSVFGAGVAAVPSDPGNRAYFAGAGTPGQQVILSHTTPLELVSTTDSSDTIQVLGLMLDGPPTRTIDATRAYFFGIGGTIMLNPNQPEGLYEATFDVTANYL